MTGKIEIYKDRKKEWRFRIKSRNGKVLAHGEGYKDKRNIKKALEAIETVVLSEEPIEI